MIDIFLDAKNLKNLGSGFSVILKSESVIWKRSIKYGMNTPNCMALHAVKFGLLSISKPYQLEPIFIKSRIKYVADMFEWDIDNNCYRRLPSANAVLVAELRDLITGKNITFQTYAGKEVDECSEMVDLLLREGKSVDLRE